MDKRRQLGRSKNAILSFLERRLTVPKIYLDAEWEDLKFDVLAIDRDGVGDVHAILLHYGVFSEDHELDIEQERLALAEMLGKLSNARAQYKYVASFMHFSRQGVAVTFLEDSFADDGLGRVGYLSVEETSSGELRVSMPVKPERFRASVTALADEFVEKHTADWEIRA